MSATPHPTKTARGRRRRRGRRDGVNVGGAETKRRSMTCTCTRRMSECQNPARGPRRAAWDARSHAVTAVANADLHTSMVGIGGGVHGVDVPRCRSSARGERCQSAADRAPNACSTKHGEPAPSAGQNSDILTGTTTCTHAHCQNVRILPGNRGALCGTREATPRRRRPSRAEGRPRSMVGIGGGVHGVDVPRCRSRAPLPMRALSLSLLDRTRRAGPGGRAEF